MYEILRNSIPNAPRRLRGILNVHTQSNRVIFFGCFYVEGM